MIPICLITGFLGTGKTTLLKRIVAENRARKWVYLVNEFSTLDVDGAMVSEDNPNVVSIPGGSIFCKCLVTEFIGQMSKIYEQHANAEGVIIEASGMADPRVIADMLEETGLGRHFELANIVSIVDPRSFLRLIHTLPNIIHQVEAADTVLLNKCDLFDEGPLTETEQAVRSIKPEARLVRCVKGDAVFDVLGKASEHAGLHGNYAKCRDPRYSAFSVELNMPVDPARAESLIKASEDSIYRVKGYLLSLDGPVYFDYSKAELTATPCKPKAKYGLAWIVRGDAEEGLNAEAVYASLSRNN